ncbi:MAG: helix-turn-helix transcriptional regulator, partial [Myxococcales bacterium]|nr:helix-turn-helix transcriptional regulator [Myxococcales bacterium]
MRSYKQYCGVAQALDLVGQRWTLLLVRDLLPGPRRYSDLLDALPGITTNLLADRLRELVSAGLIEKRTLPAPAGSAVYALTPRGQALEDVILALGRFGEQYLVAPGDDRVDFRWFAVSLRRRFRSDDPRPF